MITRDIGWDFHGFTFINRLSTSHQPKSAFHQPHINQTSIQYQPVACIIIPKQVDGIDHQLQKLNEISETHSEKFSTQSVSLCNRAKRGANEFHEVDSGSDYFVLRAPRLTIALKLLGAQRRIHCSEQSGLSWRGDY
ncbi:MAG: hypothetical protein J0H89_10270 [Rhizobiales bacterium]|nr:hypothetical protein [Hyphomicrobiales bacterium]